jgi:hypothetical protein
MREKKTFSWENPIEQAKYPSERRKEMMKKTEKKKHFSFHWGTREI